MVSNDELPECAEDCDPYCYKCFAMIFYERKYRGEYDEEGKR